VPAEPESESKHCRRVVNPQPLIPDVLVRQYSLARAAVGIATRVRAHCGRRCDQFEERSHFLSFLSNEGWHARNSCKQSCSTCTEPPPQSAATLGISFLLVARLLRFALVREGQYRERSPLSKPLVKASVKTFDQFVDYLEPASSLNLCGG